MFNYRYIYINRKNYKICFVLEQLILTILKSLVDEAVNIDRCPYL